MARCPYCQSYLGESLLCKGCGYHVGLREFQHRDKSWFRWPKFDHPLAEWLARFDFHDYQLPAFLALLGLALIASATVMKYGLESTLIAPLLISVFLLRIPGHMICNQLGASLLGYDLGVFWSAVLKMAAITLLFEGIELWLSLVTDSPWAFILYLVPANFALFLYLFRLSLLEGVWLSIVSLLFNLVIFAAIAAAMAAWGRN